MTLLDYLKSQFGVPTQPYDFSQDPTAMLMGQTQPTGMPDAPSAPPIEAQSPISAPAMPNLSPMDASAPPVPSTGDIPAAPGAPHRSLMDALRDPGVGRMLLSAGAALMAAGGPSERPVSTGQALAQGINQGGGAFDQYRAQQEAMAERKQALSGNQWTTLSPDDTKKAIPGGVAPGYIAQRNGNGEIRVVGQDVIRTGTGYDANGYPIQYPIDIRKTGAGAPATGGGNAPGGSTTQKVAHLIATYQMAPLSSFALRTPAGQAIMAQVATENPNYQANNFTEYQKAYKDFGTGKQGTQVKSFGVAMAHLNTLNSLTDALDNGNVKLLNQASNAFKTQFGRPAPTNFNAAKQIVGDEIVKAVTGAGGALGDREKAQDALNAANSPEALKGVIETYKQLMAGQLAGLKRQFESSTGRNDFEDAMKLPPDVINELEGGSTAAPANPALSGMSNADLLKQLGIPSG